MEPLKQLGTQLANIWKQLGVNQRVIVAAGGVGVFASLLGLALWSSKPSYSLLYGNLGLKEMDTLRNALEAQSIPHRIGNNGQSIMVPSAQVHEARIFLAGKGLPNSTDKVGLEIFDRPPDRKSTRLELQSHSDLVCRLLLEKKKTRKNTHYK